MVLNIIGNNFHYEAEKLTMAFFSLEKIRVLKEEPFSKTPESEKSITIELTDVINVSYHDNASNLHINRSVNIPIDKENSELYAMRLLYDILSEVTGIKLSWGILTGVRPSKLMNTLIAEHGEEKATKYFEEELYVTPKKTTLAKNVARAERIIMDKSSTDSFSLYVSIPFCPTRCSYCSFVSSAVNKESAKKLIPQYFDNLLLEIKETANIANNLGIKMLSAYIGGGTPSTLSAEQIELLLKTISDSFDMSNCKEFTFEAGRPDTITSEKLKALKNSAVTRISINPQTMSDEILKIIGRNHSVAAVYDSFKDARNTLLNNINMDLIAGLPNDTPEGFKKSLMEIVDLAPESITIHTLAYKRSSDLDYKDNLFANRNDTAIMVDTSAEILYNRGYIPYYMYRQAKSAGNLENVGWAKPGFESIYNIYMMEECHTILACGAGAVTKLKDPYGKDIERVFNFKYPYEYNGRFNEILERKNMITDFYHGRNNGRV